MTSHRKKEKKSHEQVVNPHDKVVKAFLSEKETAESFFREYLPHEITAELDLSSLKLSKESFIDKKLSAYFSDLLYEVKLKNQSIFIYLLIEHKSWVDSLTSFQLLKYMVRIWELYLKQRSETKTLPVVLPVVIYHGEQPWNIETNFISLFEESCLANVRAHIPNFRFILLDISHLPDEEIKGAVLLRVIFKTLKYIFTPELRYKLPEVFQLFLELKNKTKGTEYLEVLLRYLSKSARGITQEELKESVTKIFIDGGTIMETIAERLLKKGRKEGMEKGMEKGIEKGMEKGIEKGKLDIVKVMKNKGLPLDKIAEYTGLSRKEIEQFAG